jgi:hypothetical protein
MTTISDEANRLRLDVARLRPGRGRKYTPGLRRRILAWVDHAKQTGMLDIDCSNALGIPQHRFEIWRTYEHRPRPKSSKPKARTKRAPGIGGGIWGGKRKGAGRPPKLTETPTVVETPKSEPTKPAESTSFVPIEIPPTIQVGLGLAFTSLRGLRIEGLTFEQAFALLKEFE